MVVKARYRGCTLALAGLVLVISTLAVVSLPRGSNDLPIVEAPEISSNSEAQYVEASWAIWFKDFKDLLDRCGLIIVGRVERSTLDADDLIFTNHQVLVLENIKDDQGRVKTGDIIIVRQFGGMWSPEEKYEPIPVEFRDSSLMKEGGTSLLFLLGCDSDGRYGGLHPQTRFVVTGGRVYWLGAVYKDRGISTSNGLKIEGRTIEEITSLLREIRDKPD